MAFNSARDKSKVWDKMCKQRIYNKSCWSRRWWGEFGSNSATPPLPPVHESFPRTADTVSLIVDKGAALFLATSIILSTSEEIYLSLARISLCSGDISVSSDNAGGGVANKAAVGAVFSLPKGCWALLDKLPQESKK